MGDMKQRKMVRLEGGRAFDMDDVVGYFREAQGRVDGPMVVFLSGGGQMVFRRPEDADGLQALFERDLPLYEQVTRKK
jgi:hypothetical protein